MFKLASDLPQDNIGEIGYLPNKVTEDDIDLTALEKKWEREGKDADKIRSLRYYYRNKSKYKIESTRKKRDSFLDEIEPVSRGLIDL